MSRARLYKAGLKANAIVEKHLQTDYQVNTLHVYVYYVVEIEREIILINVHPAPAGTPPSSSFCAIQHGTQEDKRRRRCVRDS